MAAKLLAERALSDALEPQRQRQRQGKLEEEMKLARTHRGRGSRVGAQATPPESDALMVRVTIERPGDEPSPERDAFHQRIAAMTRPQSEKQTRLKEEIG